MVPHFAVRSLVVVSVLAALDPTDKLIRFENRDGAMKFGQELTVDASTNGPFAVGLSDLDDEGLAEIFTTRSVGWDKAVTLYANTGDGFGAVQDAAAVKDVALSEALRADVP